MLCWLLLALSGKALASEITIKSGLYDHYRYQSANGPYDTHGFALGADLSATLTPADPFSLGVRYLFADSAGTKSHANHYNPDLAGQDGRLAGIIEAYGQYKAYDWLLRVGRQSIQTPFANPDLYTLKPRTFAGIWASYDGLPVHLAFARMFKRASRFDDVFDRGNRYMDGDTQGLLATGVKGGPLAYWYYRFYDLADLHYGTLTWPFQNWTFAIQGLYESESGQALLGPVLATLWGVKISRPIQGHRLSLVWDMLTIHDGTFRRGGIVHPYNDLSGTLYTDTINFGLENTGPAKALGLVWQSPEKPWVFSLRGVYYWVRHGFDGEIYDTSGPLGFPDRKAQDNQNVWAIDGGLLWRPQRYPRFVLDYTVGVRDVEHSRHGPFVENRLHLIYSWQKGF